MINTLCNISIHVKKKKKKLRSKVFCKCTFYSICHCCAVIVNFTFSLLFPRSFGSSLYFFFQTPYLLSETWPLFVCFYLRINCISVWISYGASACSVWVQTGWSSQWLRQSEATVGKSGVPVNEAHSC